MPNGTEARVLHSWTKRGDQRGALDPESCSHVRRTGRGDCRRRTNSDFAVFYEWIRTPGAFAIGLVDVFTAGHDDLAPAFGPEARESINVVAYNGVGQRPRGFGLL